MEKIGWLDPEFPFDFNRKPGSENRRHLKRQPADRSLPPIVTLITPFYNTGDEFLETAASVMVQTLQQFEWIIVNDGSTDADSLDLLAMWRDRDPRIRVVDHAENKGLSAARNTGFEEASTEYVFQLDSDDLIEPTTLEKCYWCLLANPEIGFVKGLTVGFGARPYAHYIKSFEHTDEFFYTNPVSATAMVRRSVHQAVGGYDESRVLGFEDWDFWLRCAAKGFWGKTIWEHLDWYRTRDNHADRWEAFQAKQFDRFREYITSAYPQLKENGFPRARFGRSEDTEPVVLREKMNRLSVSGETVRVLVLTPLGNGSRNAAEQIERLKAFSDLETTICISDGNYLENEQALLDISEDIFFLPSFLDAADWILFVNYLIQSRTIDAVCTFGSPLSIGLLPQLAAVSPHLGMCVDRRDLPAGKAWDQMIDYRFDADASPTDLLQGIRQAVETRAQCPRSIDTEILFQLIWEMGRNVNRETAVDADENHSPALILSQLSEAEQLYLVALIQSKRLRLLECLGNIRHREHVFKNIWNMVRLFFSR